MHALTLAVRGLSLVNTIKDVVNIQNPIVVELKDEKLHSVSNGKRLKTATHPPASNPKKEMNR